MWGRGRVGLGAGGGRGEWRRGGAAGGEGRQGQQAGGGERGPGKSP